MNDKDRDRLIEAAEELKAQRTRETCRRVVVYLKGREYNPGRYMRDRYFVVNIPKDSLGDSIWENANYYINTRERFPIFWEMMMGGKYESARAVHFLGDGREEIEDISG